MLILAHMPHNIHSYSYPTYICIHYVLPKIAYGMHDCCLSAATTSLAKSIKGTIYSDMFIWLSVGTSKAKIY
jgi:hypothetical protein